jgi:Rrf2 family transcriptional regulator, nitric oxide-sensitive transcriptional repressor
MRLLASTDYALRILMRLALLAPGEQLNVEALARELGGLSRHHLYKVVQDLTALGLVRTTRGIHGGVALARPAAEIHLGELVRRLEADQALVECFRADGGGCVLTPRCRLKRQLARAREAFFHELDGATLADSWEAGSPPAGQAGL